MLKRYHPFPLLHLQPDYCHDVYPQLQIDQLVTVTVCLQIYTLGNGGTHCLGNSCGVE